jgi:hypothetical protein
MSRDASSKTEPLLSPNVIICSECQRLASARASWLTAS